MANRTAVLVLCLAVISVELSLCLGDETWTDWAKGKFTEFGGKDAKDATENSINKAGDTMSSTASDAKQYGASKVDAAADLTTDAKNYANEKANGAMNTVSGKAGDAKETMENAVSQGKDKASDAFNSASDKANQARKMANDKANDYKDTLSAAMSYDGEAEVKKAYEEAKAKAGGGYVSFRDVMTARANDMNNNNH